jgi:uncharacterized membrane protein YhhN
MTPHLPALFCVVCTAALVWAEVSTIPWLRILAKSLAAASFIAYALTMGAASAGSPGVWVLGALGLSAIGDLCLLSKEEGPFLAGIGAFLLGHVAYIGAFVALGVHWGGVAIATAPVVVLSSLIWRWLAPHTGSLKGAVAAYVVVISAMVTMAVGSAALEQSPGRMGLLFAAIVFFLSDLCVARDRFVAPGPNNRVVGLPLYFGAQLVFAGTIALAVG